MSSETFSNLLLRDLSRLYSDADDYDVILKVGEDPKIGEFKAHSNILRIRSNYFNAALSSNWARKEGNIITFRKPNIKPNVFKVVLKYIYTGTIILDASIVEDLDKLLIAVDEINLDELIDYIQNHIVTTLIQELSEKNIIKLFNTVSCCQGVFNILYEHIRELISSDPERFFNVSNSYLKLEDDALLSLVQNVNFRMEEIEIWDNLLKWAIAKNPSITPNTSLWKIEEMEVIKSTIQQFIPHIRFFQISSRDYYNKIRPLSALLPEGLEKDINLCSNRPESPLVIMSLPPRIIIDSGIIIKLEHIYKIANWIDRQHRDFHSRYKFNLLLRGSRDGFNVEPFKKKCYDKGATVVLIKLKGKDKIIGGYNPINWSGKSNFVSTNDSFIFSFQSNLNSSTTILSRVKNEENAICDSKCDNHGFGRSDLCIFRDYCIHANYEKRIIGTSRFKVEDYEVFQVVKKH